jgi:hypothetical protein
MSSRFPLLQRIFVQALDIVLKVQASKSSFTQLGSVKIEVLKSAVSKLSLCYTAFLEIVGWFCYL